MTIHPGDSRRAMVVFIGETELKWLWLLKKGHRHCFAIIEGETGWAVYNPLSHYTEIKLYPDLKEDEIAGFYRGFGYTVVKTWVREPARKPAPIAPYTCVEAVKRAIGVQARMVATPWQLRQHLEKIPNKGKIT